MLIYAPKITNRLGYTFNVIFHHLLSADYTMTTDERTFRESSDAKLCYSDKPIGETPYICTSRLMFSTRIEEQELHPFEIEGMPAIFPIYGKNVLLPFDPFAAIFYVITRYEEYLPHRVDEHGRYPASESFIYQQGWLQIALADRWAIMLKEALQKEYPDLSIKKKSQEFITTIDIDAAYSYLHKGLVRSMAGVLRDLRKPEAISERIRVLMHKKKDPFDTFDFILENIKNHTGVRLLFFVLLGDYSQYNKPTSYQNNHFRELLQHLGDYSKIGIHASYEALEMPELIKKETQRLTAILHRPIVRNRFHFLRLQIPKSYRDLEEADIKHDYSMGYAEEVGFRCGTANTHPFFDLERDEETSITVHPFVVMDTTFKRYKKIDSEAAFEIYKQLIDETKATGGTFRGIWHNQNLSDDDEWRSWRELFVKVLDYQCQTQP